MEFVLIKIPTNRQLIGPLRRNNMHVGHLIFFIIFLILGYFVIKLILKGMRNKKMPPFVLAVLLLIPTLFAGYTVIYSTFIHPRSSQWETELEVLKEQIPTLVELFNRHQDAFEMVADYDTSTVENFFELIDGLPLSQQEKYLLSSEQIEAVQLLLDDGVREIIIAESYIRFNVDTLDAGYFDVGFCKVVDGSEIIENDHYSYYVKKLNDEWYINIALYPSLI